MCEKCFDQANNSNQYVETLSPLVHVCCTGSKFCSVCTTLQIGGCVWNAINPEPGRQRGRALSIQQHYFNATITLKSLDFADSLSSIVKFKLGLLLLHTHNTHLHIHARKTRYATGSCDTKKTSFQVCKVIVKPSCRLWANLNSYCLCKHAAENRTDDHLLLATLLTVGMNLAQHVQKRTTMPVI